MTSPVFYTDNNQPVDMMGLVQRHSGGLFISHLRTPVAAHRRRFPELSRLYRNRLLMGFDRASRELQQAKVIVLGGLGSAWRQVKPLPAKKVTLFHGTFRTLFPGLVANHCEFDHLFLNGPRQERLLKQALKQLNINVNFTWSVTGYIPFDEFPRPNESEKTTFLEEIGCAPPLPVVTYLPARRKQGSFLDYALDLVEQLSGVNLIIRPHPNQLKSSCRSERIYLKKLHQAIAEHDNCYLDGASGYHQLTIPKLLSHSDLLISDGTSPAEEAMFYDIPQIITEHQPREQHIATYRHSGMVEEDITRIMRLYDCGLSFRQDQFDHWGKAVDYLLNHPDQHHQARQDYFHDAFGEIDQQSAKRVAEALQSFK